MQNKEYVYSFNGEDFRKFDDETMTEEQAMTAATRIAEEKDRNVYIGVAHPIAIDELMPDLADTAIELISEYAYDEVGECAEDYLSNVSDDAEIDLNNELCNVVRKWAKKHKLEPTFFRVDDIKSVWDIKPKELCAGRPVGLMWLSPDCKHFSRAKGGKPVSKNVRGLAWIALKWAATVKPRVIILENVPEFVTWGRLGKDNKPDPAHIGETFNSFVRALKSYGYAVEWKELKACDYGAPTIRKRFFLIARCDGKQIVFPQATHGEGLKPYHTAAECIDWNVPCNSIFGREKPLADNTMRRIVRGLVKFTINSGNPYIMSNNTGNTAKSIDEPVPTVTTGNRNFLCSPHISKYFGGVVGASASEPLPTVTAIDHNALVAPSLIQYHTEQGAAEVRGQELTEPIMTVDASPRYALTSAHIIKYYSGDHYSSVAEPLHTITTRERNALIETKIVKYSGKHNVYNWAAVREMLNKYCDYHLSDDEILLLIINGESYFIADIGMRMLTPRELYRAQGFPEDYIIDFDVNGKKYSRSAQIARCGNAVPPPFAEALVRANLPEMCGMKFTSMRDCVDSMAV